MYSFKGKVTLFNSNGDIIQEFEGATNIGWIKDVCVFHHNDKSYQIGGTIWVENDIKEDELITKRDVKTLKSPYNPIYSNNN